MMDHLDRTDVRILELLQRDGRLSHVELAGRVVLSPTPCTRRVRRLDLTPFLVRDPVVGRAIGRPDALAPRPFHELLCQRVDLARPLH